MHSVQVSKANGPFELVERDIPEPSATQVRIKVQACGICHGDSATKEGLFPGIQYPRVPGHEIAGIIDEIGVGVTEWKRGKESPSGGMVAIAVTANPAGAGISSRVSMHRYQVFPTMVAMQTT